MSYVQSNIASLLDRVRRTPARFAGGAARRDLGGEISEGMESPVATNRHDEMDIVVESVSSPDIRATNVRGVTGTSREGSGTSTPRDSSYVHPIRFINTEAVEDERAGRNFATNQGPPMNQEGLSSGQTRATNTTTLGQDLLSARTSSSLGPSVGWLNSKGQHSSHFGVVQIPSEKRDYELMCRKKIGSGTTICIKSGCTTNHRGRERVKFRLGEILVHKVGDSAFLEPTTNYANISSEVLEVWLSSRFPMDEWSLLFAVANGTQAHEVLNPDELEQATMYAGRARAHKSPGLHDVSKSMQPQAKLSTQLFKEFGPGWQFAGSKKRSASQDELGEDGSQRRRLSEEFGPPTDADKLGKLDDSIDHIYSLLEFITGKLDEKDQALAEEVKILFSRIEVTQTDIGKRASNRTDRMQVPTIWASIASIADVIEEMQLALQSVPSTDSMKKFLVTEFEKIEDAAHATVSIIIQDLQTKIADIIKKTEASAYNSTTEIHNLREALRLTQENTDRVLYRLAEGSAILQDEIDDVRQMSRSRSGTGLSSAPLGVSGAGSCSNYVSIPTFQARMLLLDVDLDVLRDTLGKLVSDADGNAIKSFGLGFRDRKSSEEWAASHLVSLPYGLVVDAHLVFEHLNHMSAGNEAGSSILKTFQQIQKLELSNMTQSLCITSFENRVPKILSTASMVNSSKFTKGGVSHFDKAPTYAKWDDPITGTKEIVKETLTAFSNMHQELIDSKTAPDSKARMIATNALQTARLWITDFICYIDDTYKGFMKQNTFTEDKAWELTTQLGKRVLWEVSAPRMGVGTSISIGQQTQTAMLVFWPMLRSQDVMKAYSDASFRDHPTIAGEYVKFLTANSGGELVAQAFAKMKQLQEDNVAIAKVAKDAKAESSKAFNMVDELKKKFYALEKSFKDLAGNKRT